MKKTIRTGAALLLILCALLSLAACRGGVSPEELWKNASYTQDTELGSGGKTLQVEVRAGEKSVTFTLKTDKTTVGDALLEHGLISGDEGEYGLYVKVVNGITADFDTDGSYWGFYQNGEMMMVGVDGAEITDGAHYELVRTK